MAAATEVARRDLGCYGLFAHGLRPARHHRVWLEAIEDLVSGRSAQRKLLIIAPPAHGKSTWIGLCFPCWYLGRHPDHSVLFLTSADSQAGQFSGTVKATLEGNERHARAFPSADVRPNPSRGWSGDGLYLHGTPASSKDPAYRAVGYGASIIGARAHGIIVDDPLTQAQAQSAVEQERAKAYHDMTVDSRLQRDGWEIAIMTRWHENDLASYLMAKDSWRVLVMPADGYWGEGQALWPEVYDSAWLDAKRTDIGGPQFACVYQGDPSALGGAIFQESAWFRPLPDGLDVTTLTILQFWDLAFSERTTADYTVCVTLGVDAVKNFYVLGVFRRRMTPEQTVAAMVEQDQLWRPAVVGVEEAAFRQAITKEIVEAATRISLAPILTIAPAADKVTRALLPAARAEAGKLYADRAAPWFPVFEAECLGFPLAAHDDQVDALAGAAEIAARRMLALPPEPTPYTFGPDPADSPDAENSDWLHRGKVNPFEGRDDGEA